MQEINTLPGLYLDENGRYRFRGSTTRDIMAKAYGTSVRGFRRLLKRHDIHIPGTHYVIARDVQKILDTVGAPEVWGQI